tara:strand:+ start:281 stop:406 length:126 start_codon:yes stop_codon:yes gene_type:complete
MKSGTLEEQIIITSREEREGTGINFDSLVKTVSESSIALAL